MTVKAADFDAFHEPLRIRDIEISEPGFDELPVEVKPVGLCLTDAHISEGMIPIVIRPLVRGDEFAGDIPKKGWNVEQVEMGDRVTLNIDVTCG